MHHYSVKPLAVMLRPSYSLAAVLGAAALAAMVLLALLPGPYWVRLPLAIAVIVHAAAAIRIHALRISPRAIAALDIDQAGRLRCLLGGDWIPASVQDRCYVTPWLTVLNLRCVGYRFSRHAVLLPDAADADALRRLRVWLRWGRHD